MGHISDTRHRTRIGCADVVYAREVRGEFRKFGLELVVHHEDGELGALRVALRLGKSLEGAFDVRLELAHGVTGRQCISA